MSLTNSKNATSSAKAGMNAGLLTASSSNSSWVVCGLGDNGHDLPKIL
nr:hypothetical protein [uncultured Arsenicibacter sp.]